MTQHYLIVQRTKAPLGEEYETVYEGGERMIPISTLAQRINLSKEDHEYCYSLKQLQEKNGKTTIEDRTLTLNTDEEPPVFYHGLNDRVSSVQIPTELLKNVPWLKE